MERRWISSQCNVDLREFFSTFFAEKKKKTDIFYPSIACYVHKIDMRLLLSGRTLRLFLLHLVNTFREKKYRKRKIIEKWQQTHSHTFTIHTIIHQIQPLNIWHLPYVYMHTVCDCINKCKSNKHFSVEHRRRFRRQFAL